MMADQDRNVKQWWEDRNNLIKAQITKKEGTRSLNEVLYADQSRLHAISTNTRQRKGIGGTLSTESVSTFHIFNSMSLTAANRLQNKTRQN
jgi:hypothetical protein